MTIPPIPDEISVLVAKLAQRFLLPAWDDQRLEYFEHELADLDPDVLRAVVLSFYQATTLEYCPNVPTIRQAVALRLAELAGFRFLDADTAWQMALAWVRQRGRYRGVPDTGDALVRRTIERIGGFTMLCDMEADQVPSHRKRFLDAYTVELDYELECAAARPGAVPIPPALERVSRPATLPDAELRAILERNGLVPRLIP